MLDCFMSNEALIREREFKVEAGEGFGLVRGVQRASGLGVERWRRMTESIHGMLPKQAEHGEMNACLAPAV